MRYIHLQSSLAGHLILQVANGLPEGSPSENCFGSSMTKRTEDSELARCGGLVPMESHAVDGPGCVVLLEAAGSMTIILISQVTLIAPRANSYGLRI